MTAGNPRTVDDFIREATHRLADASLDAPRAEARALVAALTGRDITQQLAHGDVPLSADECARLDDGLARRVRRVPLQYIAGRGAFDGLIFRVTPATLPPRPDTEMLVELAERRATTAALDRPMAVLDTCTGTGAVGIALARRLEARGIAHVLTLSDISAAAAAVARDNVRALLSNPRSVRVCTADLWPDGVYDLITVNPPYIPTGTIETLMPEVAVHEPNVALDGGGDGQCFYRRLAREGRDHLRAGGCLAVEIGAGQAASVRAIFDTWGWEHRETVVDVAGHDRAMAFYPACE